MRPINIGGIQDKCSAREKAAIVCSPYKKLI